MTTRHTISFNVNRDMGQLVKAGLYSKLNESERVPVVFASDDDYSEEGLFRIDHSKFVGYAGGMFIDDINIYADDNGQKIFDSYGYKDSELDCKVVAIWCDNKVMKVVKLILDKKEPHIDEFGRRW